MKIGKSILLSAFAALLFGCQEATEYKPSIYITEAQREEAKIITISSAGERASFSVTAAQRVSRETHIQLEVRPELVAEYNAKYGRECVALKESDFEFAKKEVVIRSGSNVSDVAEVIIKRQLDPGSFYCIPVSIASTDGEMPILEPSRTLFLVLRAPVTSDAVYIGSGNKYFVPGFAEDKSPANLEGVDLSALKELTLECRVLANSFTQSDPYISSIMGWEGNVCMRFGDVKIGWDVVQVCKGDYQPAAINAPCSTGKWYHLAAVWSASSLRIYIDGKFITETANQGETVDISGFHSLYGQGIGFALGAASIYNNNRPLNGYLAEARVWARALSGNEIANNKDLVVVDPKSEGLIAYWRMNGETNTIGSTQNATLNRTFNNSFEDLTGNGYTAYGQSSAPTFIDATW